MRIIAVKDYQEMSKRAAQFLQATVTVKPDAVLGLATGSTPIGMYEQLAKSYNEGLVDFSKVSAVNLDEYKGLERSNDQSYHYFMNQNLFSKINIDLANTYIPDGTKEDAIAECQAYEEKIEALGGVDIQVLGIGHNGHIGFNEPADYFPAITHHVDLQEKTIEANKRFFASIEEVPKQAYTMGIGTIMKAKKILLIACGEDKADILAQAIQGEITPQVPASVLQMHHDVVVIADEAALSKLKA